MNIQVGTPPSRTVQVQFGFVADLGAENETASAASKSSGAVATIIGIITLMVTASGVFGEMQTALNAIWKAKPKGTTVSQLIRARAVSLGLVAALGFLLMVSLVVSTGLTAFGNYLDATLCMTIAGLRTCERPTAWLGM
jgi:uncharacterized BrkB/YihY/UPF0761 family membrane protein